MWARVDDCLSIQEDGVYVQHAPVKTICMLTSFAAILLFSNLTSMLFSRNLLPQEWDVLKVREQKASAAPSQLEAAKKKEREQLDVTHTTAFVGESAKASSK